MASQNTYDVWLPIPDYSIPFIVVTCFCRLIAEAVVRTLLTPSILFINI